MAGTFYRPEPILKHAATPVDESVPPRRVALQLREGQTFQVTDWYRTGAEIMSHLDDLMPSPPADAPYAKRRAHAKRYQAASARLLAPIIGHRLALKDGRPIGFLEELYPELNDFYLPFARVQELFGAWQLYLDGVHLAVLGRRVYPYFGTYVPTRTSHLELFGTWLSQYRGGKTLAMDVGTGCGVLSFMLAKSGFANVVATDSNPNAAESVRRELRRLTPSPAIEVEQGDLLGNRSDLVDLIVFNPPWIPGEVEGVLDQALIYEAGLFERFFEQCASRLTPTGRIVLVFSNIMELVRPDVPHPIRAELEGERFVLVQKLQRKVKPGRDERGGRRRTREKVEVWELSRKGTLE